MVFDVFKRFLGNNYKNLLKIIKGRKQIGRANAKGQQKIGAPIVKVKKKRIARSIITILICFYNCQHAQVVQNGHN